MNTEKTAVHCPTLELAIKVLEKAHNEGKKWANGESLLELDNWDESICYMIGDYVSYAEKHLFENRGYTIIPAEEYLKPKITRKWLEENDWFIRGCKEFDMMIRGIELPTTSADSNANYGHFYKDGKWSFQFADQLSNRIEITLSDYLSAMGKQLESVEQSQEDLDKELKQKEKDAIEFLKLRNYFVFPKAPEGDFLDLSGGFGGYKMIGPNGTSVYVLLKKGSSFMLDSGKRCSGRDLKPLKQSLTYQDIVEKIGLEKACELAGVDLSKTEIKN